jgi:hypothetical protein
MPAEIMVSKRWEVTVHRHLKGMVKGITALPDRFGAWLALLALALQLGLSIILFRSAFTTSAEPSTAGWRWVTMTPQASVRGDARAYLATVIGE